MSAQTITPTQTPRPPASPRSLPDALTRRAADARAAARARYPELLRLESAKPADVAELEDVLATLGKTHADMRQDLAAIAEARRLESVVADGANLASDAEAAADAIQQYKAETARIVAERGRGLRALFAAQDALNRRASAAREALQELRALRLRHGADLFPGTAGPPPESESKLPTVVIDRFNRPHVVPHGATFQEPRPRPAPLPASERPRAARRGRTPQTVPADGRTPGGRVV